MIACVLGSLSGLLARAAARNDFWELAGGLPNARLSRGRLGVGLLYSRKATALAELARSARRGHVEPLLINRPEACVAWVCTLQLTLQLI